MTDPNFTHLALLVDRSGSMAPIASDMNGAISTMLAEHAKAPGKILVDVTTFDDEIEFPYRDVHPNDIAGDVLVPRGLTALNDALGRTIVSLGERLSALNENDRPGHVIFVIVTDGAENASKEFTTDQVSAMVTEQREKYNWEFLFLAANIDAFSTGATYGFDAGQTIQYGFASAGAHAMMAAATASTLRSRSGADGSFTQDERDGSLSV